MTQLPKTAKAFFFHFAKPYKWLLVALGSVWITIAGNYLFDSYLLKLIVDRVITYPEPHNLLNDKVLLLFIAAFVLVHLANTMLWRMIDYLFLKIFPAMKVKILSEVFEYLTYHSHAFFQNHLSGNIVNKVSDLGKTIEDSIRPFSFIFRIFWTVIFSLVLLGTVHLYFSILLLAWVVCFMTASLWVSKGITPYVKDYVESRSLGFGKLADNITNIGNIRLFAHENFELSSMHIAYNEVAEKDRLLRWKLFILWTVQGILCVVIIALMITLVIFLRAKNMVTVGDFVFIATLTLHIIEEIWGASEHIAKIVEQIGICNQALSTIAISHDVNNTPNAHALKVTAGKIEFKNVTFNYHNNDNLFNNVNVTIKSGQKVGLVGYSGSGKTTFVNLMIRLFDIQNGEILIDNQNIALVNQQSLRSNISFIPQDALLFHRTLVENIRYGRLDASDKEVIIAAKKAHADEFIIKTPHGYQSLVGERGIKLSGGQRQRIAIARAMLKNSLILILDEATSSLDSVTEGLIQESLNELMHNKTVVVIAHRLSTLLNMDRILVFDKGHIVQDGTHLELISKPGLYKTLWDAQIGGFLPDQKED